MKANIFVGSISKLVQEDMRYDMDVFFRQFWNDPRLNLSNFTDKMTTGMLSLNFFGPSGNFSAIWLAHDDGYKSQKWKVRWLFSVDEKLINSLWIPDLFFSNGVGSSRHHVVRRNALLSMVFIIYESFRKQLFDWQNSCCGHQKRLSPKGDITYSEHFTVNMDCEMNFEMFPFDSQACPLMIESYAYG